MAEPEPRIPEAPERFTLAFAVAESDIDALGHVNNIVYLRWVQDVAIAHWNAATTDEQRSELIWVVVRHEIDYRHPAKLGDDVAVRTWVGVASRHSFERHTAIERSDGTLLARARTLWVPLDPLTHRVKVPSAGVRARFSIPDPTSASTRGNP